MFKELGAFIDHVGRTTGRIIEQILSDEENDRRLMGHQVPDPDETINWH